MVPPTFKTVRAAPRDPGVGGIGGRGQPGHGPRLKTSFPGWCPGLKNIDILALRVGHLSVPHLETIVSRLRPGMSQKLAPPLVEGRVEIEFFFAANRI